MSATNVIVPLFSGVGGLALLGLWRVAARVLNAVHRVEAQTQNNGGSSMRDAIDRLEATTARIERRQKKRWAAINERVNALEAKENNA